MPLTIVEIEAALQADATLQEQLVQKLPSLPVAKTFIENSNKAYFDQNVGQKIGELHGKYDNDFKEVLGITKPDGKKSYEFWKEEVKQLKIKAESADPSKLTEYQTKIADLESKISKGDGNKVLKEQYQTLEQRYNTDILAKDNTINELQQKIQGGRVSGELNAGFTKIKLNPDLPNSVKDNYVKSVMDQIVRDAKINDDGKVVFYEDGKPKLNHLAAPISSEEFLREKLKDIVEQERRAGGGGGTGGAGDETQPITFTNVKTKMELTDAIEKKLLQEGKQKGTDAFKKEADELFKTNNGLSLPLR